MNTHHRPGPLTLVFSLCCLLATCLPLAAYDVILLGGTIYDGSGDKPYTGDIAFNGDKIAATGMLHVFVNGTQVLKGGEHTGAKPGRVVRGPGWKPKP